MAKDVRIEIRVSERQKDEILQKAKSAEMTLSNYMRSLIEIDTKGVLISNEEKADLKKCYGNLTRIGTNINQISRGINLEYSYLNQKLDLSKDEIIDLQNISISLQKDLLSLREKLIDIYNLNS